MKLNYSTFLSQLRHGVSEFRVESLSDFLENSDKVKFGWKGASFLLFDGSYFFDYDALCKREKGSNYVNGLVRDDVEVSCRVRDSLFESARLNIDGGSRRIYEPVFLYQDLGDERVFALMDVDENGNRRWVRRDSGLKSLIFNYQRA